jgi:antitoxin component YwqK of YwqJK toxin-antitoxin module
MIFVGEWVNGFRCGHGTSFNRGQENYVGAWKDDAKHGIGTYYKEGKTLYNGQWEADQYHGYGQEYYLDIDIIGRNKYSGHWEHGMMSGYGVAYDIGGAVLYEGHWEKNLRNGFGKSYSAKFGMYTMPDASNTLVYIGHNEHNRCANIGRMYDHDGKCEFVMHRWGDAKKVLQKINFGIKYSRSGEIVSYRANLETNDLATHYVNWTYRDDSESGDSYQD